MPYARSHAASLRPGYRPYRASRSAPNASTISAAAIASTSATVALPIKHGAALVLQLLFDAAIALLQHLLSPPGLPLQPQPPHVPHDFAQQKLPALMPCVHLGSPVLYFDSSHFALGHVAHVARVAHAAKVVCSRSSRGACIG